MGVGAVRKLDPMSREMKEFCGKFSLVCSAVGIGHLLWVHWAAGVGAGFLWLSLMLVMLREFSPDEEGE